MVYKVRLALLCGLIPREGTRVSKELNFLNLTQHRDQCQLELVVAAKARKYLLEARGQAAVVSHQE